MPKVSICIPTFNMAKYVGLAVESALNQTYSDIEVILCDNASTDNTQELLSRFKDTRLKVFRNDTNIGMIRNFNRCIELSSGEYIKFLEADDLLEKDCVTKMVEFAHQYPNIGIVSCGRSLIDSAGRVIGGHKKNKTEVLPGNRIISRIRRMGNEIGTPADVMVRRSILNSTGFFDLSYENYLNDWDLWIRCAEYSDVGFIAELLTKVRRHPEQVGAVGSKTNRDIDVNFQFIVKIDKRSKTAKKGILGRWKTAALKIHFAEEFIWRGLMRMLKERDRQSLSYLFDVLSQIKKNIRYKYLIISLSYSVIHSPVFISCWYYRKIKNQIHYRYATTNT